MSPRWSTESRISSLIDLGLHVGVRLEIVQQRPYGLPVAVNDDVRIVVVPPTAQAVLVVRLEPTLPSMTIAGTRPGRARIVGLGRGALDYRQRLQGLMAMGLTPGDLTSQLFHPHGRIIANASQ